MHRYRQPIMRIVSVILALALGVMATPAGAAPASPGAVQDVQQQAADARQKLVEMQAGLESGLSSYSKASNNLAQTRSQIAVNSKRLEAVKASLKRDQQRLGSQAEFLYRTGGTGFVDVLLGAATFEEFSARLGVLKQIASEDAGLVVALKDQRTQTQQLTAELAQRESEQTALLGKVTAQRDSVQGAVDRQQAYLGSLSAQVSSLVAQQEAATRSSTSPSPAPTSGGKRQPTPPSSSGSVKLGVATVEGRSGSWIVMAKESKKYRATGVKFSGQGTEYGTSDNGTGTSSGRPLNDSELTCAHPSLPFGTRIAVSHAGRQVIVIVTDRGPYSGGRVIDLTHRAAGLLNLDGVGTVKCEVVEPS